MEILLTILVWLWQIGWVLLLGGLLCTVSVLCVRPLRSRRVVTFAACAAAVCLLLGVLCARPVVLGDVDAGEKLSARQLAAGWYSRRIPATPVCAVVERSDTGMEVKVWYAFVGSMTYIRDGDVWSITEQLFAWS